MCPCQAAARMMTLQRLFSHFSFCPSILFFDSVLIHKFESMTNSDSEYGTYDVIILGAGISGLSTAHQILSDKPDTSLLLLEARSRCGGRIHTHDLDANAGQGSLTNNVDLGAR